MARKYFKCACAIETRKSVTSDLRSEGFVQKGNRWTFDPKAPRTAPVPAVHVCECGETVTESADPRAVNSFFQFNWIED